MVIKTIRICFSFSILMLIVCISGLMLVLGGCKTIDVKGKPDLLLYMQKPVAFLTIKSPDNLQKVWPELMGQVELHLKEMPTLGRVTGFKERNLKLDSNPKLRSGFRTYLSTLTLTGISENNLAWKLEEELNSPLFLLLDFVSFPCTKECPSNVQWVIRLKLIEAHSGDLIFQVRLQHKLDEDEKTAEAYNELAAKLTTKVVDEFASGFIVPWHRWRFEHLKPESVRKLRSEIGI